MKQTRAHIKKWSAFELLQFRVSEVHWRWKVWKQLYVVDPSSPSDPAEWESQMNSVAPAFFAMLNDVLLQDVVLRVCKLFDPPEGGPSKAKRVSLSLAAARENATGHLSAIGADSIRKKTFALQRTARPLEAWRNRRLAHDDELTATGATGLPPLQFAKIEKCLAQAAEIMVLLDPHSSNREYKYDAQIAHGDGESLKYALHMADRYRKECLARGFRPLSDAAKIDRATRV